MSIYSLRYGTPADSNEGFGPIILLAVDEATARWCAGWIMAHVRRDASADQIAWQLADELWGAAPWLSTERLTPQEQQELDHLNGERPI